MASLVAQLVKNPHAMQESLVQFLGQDDPLEKGYPLQYSWASQVAQLVKTPPANAWGLGSIPGLDLINCQRYFFIRYDYISSTGGKY